MSISTLVDLVKIQITSSGTGSFSLGPAVPGFRGVSALQDGATYSYSVQLGSNYEAGTGVYVAASATLSRTPSISSAGNAAVAFGPNAAVAFTALAQDIIATGSTVPIVNALGTNPAAAIAQQIVSQELAALKNGSAILTLYDQTTQQAVTGTVQLSGGVLIFVAS